ncbi:DUF433 domain-containing protein [Rhizobium sp. LjRoot254]|uniref:DUF433 domain-containing protein n=1 Tax=Rhizobium sp. LjRoot254 TaxID=3342297 RepID=UPI003ECC9CA5
MSSVAHMMPDEVAVETAEGVMGGEPVISGTRVPVETILIYLKTGSSAREIYEDFPTLPAGSVEAARAWAIRTLGKHWQDKLGRNGFAR